SHPPPPPPPRGAPPAAGCMRPGPDAGSAHDAERLVVRAQGPALDALVVRLVGEGIALRELAPVISPLEAAFLALTEQQEAGR
ncbi:ABC transporter ATP-binding protein, partial [Streptomyces mexicanus]